MVLSLLTDQSPKPDLDIILQITQSRIKRIINAKKRALEYLESEDIQITSKGFFHLIRITALQRSIYNKNLATEVVIPIITELISNEAGFSEKMYGFSITRFAQTILARPNLNVGLHELRTESHVISNLTARIAENIEQQVQLLEKVKLHIHSKFQKGFRKQKIITDSKGRLLTTSQTRIFNANQSLEINEINTLRRLVALEIDLTNELLHQCERSKSIALRLKENADRTIQLYRRLRSPAMVSKLGQIRPRLAEVPLMKSILFAVAAMIGVYATNAELRDFIETIKNGLSGSDKDILIVASLPAGSYAIKMMISKILSSLKISNSGFQRILDYVRKRSDVIIPETGS